MKTVFVLTYLSIGVVIVLTNWFKAIAEGKSTLRDLLKPKQILLVGVYVVFWLPIIIGAGIHLLIVQDGRMKKMNR